MSLPRQAEQFRNGLRAMVSNGEVTAADAGLKMSSYLHDKYPPVCEDLVIAWCTRLFRNLSGRGHGALPEGVQTELWPVEVWSEPISKAAAYARSMREMTARFASRDDERDAELAALRTAANGDESRIFSEAWQLAFPEAEAI